MATERRRWAPGTLLDVVDPATRAALLRLGLPREYQAGHQFIRQRERGSSVFLIISGVAKVTVTGESDVDVVLALRFPGEVVGEMAMLEDKPRSATVTALGPLSAHELDAAVLRRFIADRPALHEVLRQTPSERMRAMMIERADLALAPTVRRLAVTLLRLADALGHTAPDGSVDIPLNQHDLASLIDRTELSVSRGISALKKRAAVRTGRGLLTVQPAELRRFIAASPVDRPNDSSS